MRFAVRAAIVAIALLLAAPAPALADGWMSFFYGTTLDGTTPADVAALEERNPSAYGFSFGNMRGGVFGFETEIAFSPDFFADSDDRFIGDNSVFTWMGNFMLGVPLGSETGFSFRPFGTGGFGWIRQRIESPTEAFGFDANAFGYDIGGGAMLFFGRNFGIRADYRYYKSFDAFEIFDDVIGSDLVEEQHLDFTRVTGSVVLRF
jgi:opacity protein-like surface antigen